MPLRFAARLRRPALQLARRLPRLADLAVVALQAAALRGDLLGSPDDLAALVLDPALCLVLVGVPQAQQAALQLLALGAPGLPLRFGPLLGGQRPAVLARGGRDRLRVRGRRVDPVLYPVEREPGVGAQVAGVVGEERPDGGMRGRQVVEQLLHGGQVLEVTRRLLHEVVMSACRTPCPGPGPWPAAAGAAPAAGRAAGRTARGPGRTAACPPGRGTRSRSAGRRRAPGRP